MMLFSRPGTGAHVIPLIACGLLLLADNTRGQRPTPIAHLTPASPIVLPSAHMAGSLHVDSNSAILWDLVDGEPTLHAFTSVNGIVSLSTGKALDDLEFQGEVTWDPVAPAGGVWMESVIADAQGVWYGYYHNEMPPTACPGSEKMAPRIGAARSFDRGRTWEDLGVILSSPAGAEECETRNRYFAGGVGDFTAVLDRGEHYVYLLLSQYVRDTDAQGVAVARLLWANRDEPVGSVTVAQQGVWLPARDVSVPREDGTSEIEWEYPVATPLFPTQDSWHDGDSADAFWGPSVHWNTFLEQYVMLLNRTRTTNWDEGGIYVSFNPDVASPEGWSTPTRILKNARWYPQVIGLEHGSGTEQLAGQRAHFFMGGLSDLEIEFER